MSRILVIYGTTQGQTGKIAYTITQELASLGHSVHCYDTDDLPISVRPSQFDGVIAGASVHASGYQRRFRRWIKAHASELNGMPTAFFSVCLGILQKEEKVRVAEHQIVERFLTESGWTPQTRAIIAGALHFTRYNWVLKRVMRNISRKAGGDTDMSRDFEYTDWGQVRRLAQDFSAILSSRSASSPVLDVQTRSAG